ncbi:MAG: hypothetical protein K2X73_12835 [Sphingomonas sp.]|uniref:hypothetical protein n=1 Tax=Sphingomonas sp. TaxID=28214 RepID=UPI0025E43BBD|nr:hypothetical protein [Sphingomonas sp.]MBX9882848.1 hypothetical protein [Sphingomonas sp.]
MTTNPAVALLEREREAIRAAIAEAEVKLRTDRATLRSIEEAISTLSGGAAAAAQDTQPHNGTRLKDTVLEVIGSLTGGGTTAVIQKGLADRGRPTDVNSLLSTLSRLKAAGLIHKRSDRLWYHGPEDKEPMIEGAEHDFGFES